MVVVLVRDGRAGRVGGPAGTESNSKGEVLDTLPDGAPVEIGDILALPDGTRAKVIGIEDHLERSEAGELVWTQHAAIGNLFDDAPVSPRITVPHEARLIGAAGREFAVAFPVADDTMSDSLKIGIALSRSMKITGRCQNCHATPVFYPDHVEFHHLDGCAGSDDWLRAAIEAEGIS